MFFWYAGRMSDHSQPKLRWYQFSLRSLLLLFLFCTIPFGWLGVKMQRAREQKQAVEAIKKLGGRVQYDYQRDASGAPIKGAKPPGPAWLRQLLGDDCFTNVVALSSATGRSRTATSKISDG